LRAIRIKAKKAGNIKHQKCWAREKSSEKLQQGADYHFLTTGSNNLKLVQVGLLREIHKSHCYCISPGQEVDNAFS